MNVPCFAMATAGIVMLLSCNSPFLPPTGPSLMTGSQRSTAQGVVNQLVASYESHNINQFLALLDPVRFRFYVSPSIVGSLRSLDRNRRESVTDSVFLPGNAGVYTYVTYADERRIHQNLFSEADEISFIVAPRIDSVFVVDTFVRTDTLIGPDTLFNDTVCTKEASDTVCRLVDTLIGIDTTVVNVYDTISQVVRTLESILSIRSLERIGPDPLDFYLGKQVFYLARDDEGLWVIRAWYELDW